MTRFLSCCLILFFAGNAIGQTWPYGDPLNPPTTISASNGHWSKIGELADLRSTTYNSFINFSNLSSGERYYEAWLSASYDSLHEDPPGVYLVQEVFRANSVLGPWVLTAEPYNGWGNAGLGFHQSMDAGGIPPPVLNPYRMKTSRTYIVGHRIAVPNWAPDYYNGGYYIESYSYNDVGLGMTVKISDVPYSFTYSN